MNDDVEWLYSRDRDEMLRVQLDENQRWRPCTREGCERGAETGMACDREYIQGVTYYGFHPERLKASTVGPFVTVTL